MNGCSIIGICALLVIALVPGSGAWHGEDPFLGGRGFCPDYVIYVPQDAESTTYPAYVTIDETGEYYMFSMWVYAESNGITGLQRFDGYCTNAPREDPYAYEPIHDLIVF